MNQLNIFKILFVLLYLSSNYTFAQPNWPVTTTGDNHTIIIEGTINMDINGGSLAIGDSLGVFYDDNGTLKCAGKAQWTGSNISITAYGDDGSSQEKDGFAGGETFSWKVWRSATNEELNATATYQSPNIVITNMGTFAIDGISAVASLSATGEGGGSGEPDWPVLTTGDNHTVIIQGDLTNDLGNGATLSTGDYIGVYFDDNGTTRYAGKAKWTGQNISVTVYGDDNTTPSIKEGLIGGEIFQWRVWQAATDTEFNAAATYQPTGVVISHTDAFAIDGISALESLTADGNGGGGAPEWEVIPTSENHTLVVKADIPNRVGSSPLAEGDYLGVFYRDAQGNLQCGGFSIWNGSDVVFPAYGNDLGIGKNGFAIAETFTWKVWKASEDQEYDVMVSYASLNNLVTHQSQYDHDGLSMVKSLFSNIESQTISLLKGWNLISSYIDPIDGDIAQVLAGIAEETAIIKNIQGNSYIPSIGNNQLGNWDYKTGYAIRVTSATNLTIYGQKVDPTTPITIPANWSLLPYLKDTETPIDVALASILSNIIEVKDQVGNSFIPIFGINNIGNLKPGQAYKIRLTTESTLAYSQGSQRLGPQRTWNRSNIKPTQLVFEGSNTNNSATLVISAEVANKHLQIGDEVGVFDKNGNLYGSAVYEGEAFYITIWGANQDSPMDKGFTNQEPFKLQYWSRESRELRPLKIAFEAEHKAFYKEDELFVARKIWEANKNSFELVTNPVKQHILFDVTLEKQTHLTIDLFDLSGRRVYQFPQQSYSEGKHKLTWNHDLSKGIYTYHTVIGEKTYSGKIVISE